MYQNEATKTISAAFNAVPEKKRDGVYGVFRNSDCAKVGAPPDIHSPFEVNVAVEGNRSILLKFGSDVENLLDKYRSDYEFICRKDNGRLILSMSEDDYEYSVDPDEYKELHFELMHGPDAEKPLKRSLLKMTFVWRDDTKFVLYFDPDFGLVAYLPLLLSM